MAPPMVGTTKPAAVRTVQAVASESLVVALPLPSGVRVSQQSSPSSSVTIAASMPTHDHTFWQKFSKSPVLLKISTILYGLGLRQVNSGPGKILFQHDTVAQLADAVAEAMKKLPTAIDQLVDVATDYAYPPLQEEIAKLLHRFGEKVWGGHSERPWLLEASEGDEGYPKDLVFEEAADKMVLMYYLRLWVLVKAFNRTRNRFARGSMSSQTSTNKPEKRRVSRQIQDTSPPRQHSHNQTSASTHMATKSRAKRRTRKTHIFEEVIRNSSDESDEPEEEEDEKEEDTTPIPSLIKGPKNVDVKDHQNASSAAKHIQDGNLKTTRWSRTGSPRFDLRHTTEAGLPKGRKSIRQGPGACKSCYSRHQRCDRAQPTCGRCAELGFACEFPNALDSTTASNQAMTMRSSQVNSQGMNSRYDSGGDPAGVSSSDRITTSLKLHKYWNDEDWRLFFQKGNENEVILATMRSLGLKATPRDDAQFKFHVENFESLGEDINKIALELSSKCSAAQLFYHAEDRTYLDEDIDTLFDTYSYIWSLDADRTNLLTPGTDEHYVQDLFYEESEDQKILWIHLHRWIFLVAFWNLQQQAAPGSNNTEETPRPAGSEAVLSNKAVRRTTKRKDSATTPPSQHPIRPLKQRRTIQQRTSPAGHELCILFQSYLENYTDPSFDELAALSTLEHELLPLKDYATTVPSARAYKFVDTFVTTSFPAWLHYRTQIVEVKRRLAALHSPTLTEKGQGQRHLAVLERSRLATQLRQAREAFMHAGTGELRAEQVITMAVEVLLGDREGKMAELRRGFRRMEEELSELGGRLMKAGGAKWVMGDFESVDSLDGMEVE